MIDGKPVYSLYNPIKSVERQLSKSFCKGYRNFILFGAGLGYHSQIIRKNYPSAIIFIFEPCHELFELYKTKYCRDDSKIFNFSYRDKDELAFLFDKKLEYANLDFLQIINCYSLIPELDEQYYVFSGVLKNVIEAKYKNFWTKHCLAELWSENIAQNFKFLSKSYPVKNYFNIGNNKPVLIVCAGPSLDKSLDDIKRMENRAFIICVDTALRALIRRNIRPDIVVSLDSQKINFQDFEGLNYYDFALLYDITAYPEILKWYKGDRLICSVVGQHSKDDSGREYLKFEGIFDFIKDFIGDLGYLQTGGSVSTICLDLARCMGCDPIIFVGQDLAFSEMKTHNTDAFDIITAVNNQNKFATVENVMFSHIFERNVFPVKGNYCDFVMTDLTLKHYANWIGSAAEIMTQKIINATEGGAYIKNTELKKLGVIINEFKTFEKDKLFSYGAQKKIRIDYTGLKNSIKENITRLENILGKISGCIDTISAENNYSAEFFDYVELLRETILKLEMPMIDVYRNQYYISKRQLENFNLSREDYRKNDYLLFFMTLKNGIQKIIGFLEKLELNRQTQ